MVNAPNYEPRKPLYRLFITICVAYRKIAMILWGIIVAGAFFAMLSAILAIPLPWNTQNSHIQGTGLEPIIQNVPIIIPWLLCLILWTALASTLSRIEVGFSEKDLKRIYLERMINKYDLFMIKELPADLTVQGVQLENIVIPLEFKLKEPLTDYPLTETEEKFYKDRLKQKGLTDEESRLLQRLLNKYENSWWGSSNQEKITLTELWNKLAQGKHVAIIHGFPGMGKSILLTYLMLYMARRNLHLFYKHKTMPQLDTKLIAIYIDLGDYIKAYKKEVSENPNNLLPLRSYLTRKWTEEFPHKGMVQFIINDRLGTGRCLVLLDGLEKVESEDVQKAIVAFIGECSVTTENTHNFNRFLITSRVAPHSPTSPFPIIDDIRVYQCYTIAELTIDQGRDFCQHWLLANLSPDTVHGIKHLFARRKKQAVIRQASLQARDFYNSIKDREGIGDLSENPLFLALLAVMQQKQMLPRRPIDLYSNISHIMLETRVNADGQPTISEEKVIKGIGTLSFSMQERGIRFAHHDDVMASLKDSLRVDVETEDDIPMP